MRASLSAGMLILLLAVLPASAAIEAFRFKDAAEEQRFQHLTGELRCPKCQNQTIADSNAPLAQDLRQRVYDMIREGRSDAEITDFMVARYGDFITYRPSLKPVTWVLWFGPLILLTGIALGMWRWIRRRARRSPIEITAEERQRLQELLERSDEDGR